MNRTGVEWADRYCNFITGCKRLCDFDDDGKCDCYAFNMYRRFGKSFEPMIHPEVLDDPDFERLPKGTKIFLNDTGETFGPWILPEWHDQLFNKIFDDRYRRLIFILLTKYPENLVQVLSNYDYDGSNIWIGVTVTRASELNRVDYLNDVNAIVHFASIEPMLEPINIAGYENILEWVIVGQLTGSKKCRINPTWIHPLIQETKTFKIPLFIKNNVEWPEKIQEFPLENRGNEYDA